MLNSWFGTKDHDKTNDPSSSNDLNRTYTNITEIPDDSLKPSHKTPPTSFTSPHDAILAKMRGQPLEEDTDDGLIRDYTPAPQNDERLDGRSPTDSTPHDPNAQKDYLYDPYDGTPIGVLAPSDPHSPHHTGFKGTGAPPTRRMDSGSKEEQWVHLSRVLDLQNEVAKMHLEMEGVGTSDGKGKATGKGRGRGKGKGLGDPNIGERREWGDSARKGKAKRKATSDSIGTDTHDGDEEGVDAAGDEELEIKKAREEQFANLDDQFEGRKESIQEIMNKLDHLSKALTEFHTLKAPTFKFTKTSSRQNSTTPDRTPPLTQTSLSPNASASLPNAGLANLANPHLPSPLPSSIQSSLGSSTSALPSAREQENSIVPASLSRSPEPRKAKTPVSTLIVNMLEPGKQTHVMESPVSMKGHLELPPDS
ncbi:hypothetical protein FPV67DRAFT_1466805 [Lyophyllum atratum]|nr:hypothetical protein FPV67DRAFT_1466805 [Lyophyllum atratum]